LDGKKKNQLSTQHSGMETHRISIAQVHPEDDGSTILQNGIYYLPQNTMQYPKRLQSSVAY
jgi:hypothetical protein